MQGEVHAISTGAKQWQGQAVRHVLYTLAPTLSQFLRRNFNKALAEVTGDQVNRGPVYGLVVPCIYWVHRLSYWTKSKTVI